MIMLLAFICDRARPHPLRHDQPSSGPQTSLSEYHIRCVEWKGNHNSRFHAKCHTTKLLERH